MAICEIFEDIRKREKDPDVLRMINGLWKGRTDTAIMQDVHWRKNAYYDRKSKLVDKIYECCICRGYVDYEEIMSREIA